MQFCHPRNPRLSPSNHLPGLSFNIYDNEISVGYEEGYSEASFSGCPNGIAIWTSALTAAEIAAVNTAGISR